MRNTQREDCTVQSCNNCKGRNTTFAVEPCLTCDSARTNHIVDPGVPAVCVSRDWMLDNENEVINYNTLGV